MNLAFALENPKLKTQDKGFLQKSSFKEEISLENIEDP